MTKLSLLGLVVALAIALEACGGGGGGGGGGLPTVDVTGTWTGTWASSNGINTGDIDATLVQTGGAVTGSVSFTGSPCFAGGPITGIVSGDTINASLIAGGIQVDLSGAVSGSGNDMMNGTYDTVSAGACTGDTGTITLTRTSPLVLDGDEELPSAITTVLLYDHAGKRLGQPVKLVRIRSKQ
jgi:hypothetical protein